jgi:predicted nucleic acid-binding protein
MCRFVKNNKRYMTNETLTSTAGLALVGGIIAIISFFYSKVIIPRKIDRELVETLEELSKDNKVFWFNKLDISTRTILSVVQVDRGLGNSKKITTNPSKNMWALTKRYLEEKQKPRTVDRPRPESFGF